MKRRDFPETLASLGARERELFEVVCRLREATAEEVRTAIPDALTSSTVRTMLRLLESKGILTHRQDGRTFVYRSAIRLSTARRSMLRKVIDSFFHGSELSLVNAMLDDGTLTALELAELEQRVRDARRRIG